MTAIILTPNAVYSDTLSTDLYSGVVSKTQRKIGDFVYTRPSTLPDPLLYWAVTGSADIGMRVIEIIQKRIEENQTPLLYFPNDPDMPVVSEEGDHYSVWLVHTSGYITRICNGLVGRTSDMPFGYRCVGSALEFLNGAMAVGCTPVEAIMAAIKHRTDVGGHVEMVSDRGRDRFG